MFRQWAVWDLYGSRCKPLECVEDEEDPLERYLSDVWSKIEARDSSGFDWFSDLVSGIAV